MLACSALTGGVAGADRTDSPSPKPNQTGASPANSAVETTPLMEKLKSINISPAAKEMVRLSDAGMDGGVLQAYAESSNSPQILRADDILYLHEHGIPGAVIIAMVQRAAKVREQMPPDQASHLPEPTPAPQSAVVVPSYVAPVNNTYVAPAVSPTYVYPSYPNYAYTYPYGYHDRWPGFYGWPYIGVGFSYGGHSHYSYGHGGGGHWGGGPCR